MTEAWHERGTVLSPTKIRRRVREIADIASDDEAAHVHEDELYRTVLLHISESGCSCAALAAAALATQDIKFCRWYA